MATAGPRSGDEAVWRRVAGGDPDAFGELFDRHAGSVYSYLSLRLGDWSAAEDLTSAVFLQAWRRRAEVVFERASALPWLLGVANGLLRNEVRARRRRTELMDRVLAVRDALPGAFAVEADHADAVADRVDGERQTAALRAAVGQLPRREREVLELCVWAGLDHAAAAAALGVRPGTVKSRLHRAKRRLAAKLAVEAAP